MAGQRSAAACSVQAALSVSAAESPGSGEAETAVQVVSHQPYLMRQGRSVSGRLVESIYKSFGCCKKVRSG